MILLIHYLGPARIVEFISTSCSNVIVLDSDQSYTIQCIATGNPTPNVLLYYNNELTGGNVVEQVK